MKYPENMCWLTTLLYALIFLGFENNKKLHKKLSGLLYISFDLMQVGTDDGALYFPKKYQFSDRHIRAKLNDIFKQIKLKIKVENILTEIGYDQIHQINNYLKDGKQLLTIVKTIDFRNPDKEVTDKVPNHVILIIGIKDNEDGKVTVDFADPSDGEFYSINIGVNVFILWVQYIWVLSRKRNIVHKIFKR